MWTQYYRYNNNKSSNETKKSQDQNFKPISPTAGLLCVPGKGPDHKKEQYFFKNRFSIAAIDTKTHIKHRLQSTSKQRTEGLFFKVYDRLSLNFHKFSLFNTLNSSKSLRSSGELVKSACRSYMY